MWDESASVAAPVTQGPTSRKPLAQASVCRYSPTLDRVADIVSAEEAKDCPLALVSLSAPLLVSMSLLPGRRIEEAAGRTRLSPRMRRETEAGAGGRGVCAVLVEERGTRRVMPRPALLCVADAVPGNESCRPRFVELR